MFDRSWNNLFIRQNIKRSNEYKNLISENSIESSNIIHKIFHYTTQINKIRLGNNLKIAHVDRYEIPAIWAKRKLASGIFIWKKISHDSFPLILYFHLIASLNFAFPFFWKFAAKALFFADKNPTSDITRARFAATPSRNWNWKRASKSRFFSAFSMESSHAIAAYPQHKSTVQAAKKYSVQKHWTLLRVQRIVRVVYVGCKVCWVKVFRVPVVWVWYLKNSASQTNISAEIIFWTFEFKRLNDKAIHFSIENFSIKKYF